MSPAGQFLWGDYRELFAKAEGDLASLRRALDRDTMFNFVCTVTHIYDWILNDSRVKANKDYSAFEKELRDIKRHDPVHTISELCNAAKHLELSGRAPPEVRQGPRHWFERTFANVRRSPHLPVDETETKFVVMIDGNPRDVLDVGQDALDT